MLPRRRFLSLPVLIAWPPPRRVEPPARAAEPPLAGGAAPPSCDLVLVHRGTLPIVLTAPHGGRLAVPGVPVRATPAVMPKGNEFNTEFDPESDRIAIGVADRLRTLLRGDVHLVVARFNRKYIDPNRPPRVAFDNAAAKPHYEYYHWAIRRAVDAVRAAHPHGVLLDIHGQHKMPDALLRGTRNGQAVERLLARAGDAGITGPNGLFGRFERNAFKVFPLNSLPVRGRNEDGGFNGGYTTDTYGSHRSDGIDAIQCEFGRDYREKKRLGATIEAAAQAIAAFHDAWLRKA